MESNSGRRYIIDNERSNGLPDTELIVLGTRRHSKPSKECNHRASTNRGTNWTFSISDIKKLRNKDVDVVVDAY